MKTASTISRYPLGIMFHVFGINGFLNFIPAPPISPVGLQFYGALAASHYVVVIFGLQILCGILLLVNRYVPLVLVSLAPIIVNIFLFSRAHGAGRLAGTDHPRGPLVDRGNSRPAVVRWTAGTDRTRMMRTFTSRSTMQSESFAR